MPRERTGIQPSLHQIADLMRHFNPVFEKIQPAAAFAALGGTREAPWSQRTLHLIVLLNTKNNPTAEAQQTETLEGLHLSFLRRRPGINFDLHTYPVPFPTENREVSTLEEATHFFALEDAEQIYPTISFEDLKRETNLTP